jgi:hypothetical protein
MAMRRGKSGTRIPTKRPLLAVMVINPEAATNN